MSEAEYLLLCNLLYFEEFSNEDAETRTVASIIERGVSTKGNDYTTSQEYQALLDLAANTPSIANLTVVSTYRDDLDAQAACFVTPDGEAIAVFRGTGDYEWPDNVDGANSEDTTAQKRARIWINSLGEQGYSNITAVGHSKGGNKAMYVAVTSKYVGSCYSFDGQGFSPAFKEKYADEIAAMQGNMHSISHQMDFVNILLYDITGDRRYLANYVGVGGFAEYHTPDALFRYEWTYDEATGEWVAKPTLELAVEGEQSALMQLLNGYVCHLLETHNDEQVEIVVNTLAALLGALTENQDREATGKGIIVSILILFNSLNAHLTNLKEENPELYEEAMRELHAILVELLGITYADYLMVIFEDGKIGLSDIPSLLFNMPSAGIVRDFSAETKQLLLDAVQEVEEEKWFDITRWDCWYRAEKLFGGLRMDKYADDIATYHRKLVDINGSTAADIETLFTEVYAVETAYTQKVNAHFSTLEAEMGKLTAATARLRPASGG